MTVAKKECTVCGKVMDGRGMRSHMMMHERNGESEVNESVKEPVVKEPIVKPEVKELVVKPKVKEVVEPKVKEPIVKNLTPQKKGQTWVEAFQEFLN